MIKRAALLDLLSLILVVAAALIPQVFLARNPQLNLDWTYFAEAVALPVLLACLLFGIRKRWVLLFAFLAYIWAWTDDAPVYLDSVFTWPEVTSGFQHEFLEILLHALTFLFMFLAITVALRKNRKTGQTFSLDRIALACLLALVAFVLSYAQNIPSPVIENFVRESWYELNLLEHVASVAFLYMALVVATNGIRRPPTVKSQNRVP